MMFPITDQAQLDEIMSDRIRRERAKVHRKDAEALQPIIDEVKKLYSDLMELQKRQRDKES